MQMSNGTMAPYARGFIAVVCRRVRPVYRLCQLGVTLVARLFGYGQIARADLDGFVETARREIEGMPKAIRRLGGVFADQARWRVAIVAGRHRTMRRFQPAVILLVHHMAIGARSRVVSQIRSAFGVNKGVNAHARSQAHQRRQNQSAKNTDVHKSFSNPLRISPQPFGEGAACATAMPNKKLEN